MTGRHLPLRERQYLHVLESALDRGASEKEAKTLAARVVNKRRAMLAKKRRGPRLISQGGTRRAWYPGKGTALVCLKHRRRFKTRAGLASHRRSHG